jgi:histidyl-tRNA synthetase
MGLLKEVNCSNFQVSYVKITNCGENKMKSIVQTVKGARDFYPEEMAVRSWMYQTLRRVSELFGYQEYEGPFLERIELYAAKSGEELVKEQAFVFPDRGGDLVALRPELTPSLARMVAQKQNELAYPLRWWSWGPFWRYERPQKGRSREFFQWNIDLIGVNSPEADAELIAICATFFREIGLSGNEVKVLVNSRRLIDSELVKLGISDEQRKVVFHVIDRKDKLGLADWERYASEQGLRNDQIEGLKAILSNRDLWKQSEELVRAFLALERMGLMDFVRFEPQIIRGLDYYTGIVFEAKDLDGGRSILGGGHYDNLVAAVGGDPLPGVGFAMGDMMIAVVLGKYGKMPTFRQTPAKVLVTVFDNERMPDSLELATRLRQAGISTVCYPEAAKLQKQLKFADRVGARWVVIEGPDEVFAGVVTLKDLETRTQETLSREAVAERLVELLA